MKKASASIVPVETLIPIVEAVPEYIIGLLEEMGVIEAVGTVTYIISQGFEYISSFIDAVNPFAITIDEIVDFFSNFMSSEMYFTNGQGEYYIATGDGFKLVTSGDLYVSASGVVNANYSMPVNVKAVCSTAHAGVTMNHNAWASELGATFMSHALDYYAVGLIKKKHTGSNTLYYAASEYCFTYSGAQSFEVYEWHNTQTAGDFVSSQSFSSDWTGGTVWGYSPVMGNTTLRFSENAKWESDGQGSYINIQSYPPYLISADNLALLGSVFYYNGIGYASNSSSLVGKDTLLVSTYLITDGFPVTELTKQLPELNKDKFDNGYVNVPAPPTNLQPDQEYAPVTPEHWQIFKDLADAIANAGGDTTVNAGTTIGDYVANNYLYNTVNVDLPDIPSEFIFNVLGKVDMSLDLSGNVDVDINHGGSVDVDVNVTVSLPEVTTSDGDGLIDMGVTDVIGGLTTHNPVFPVLSSLFESIDPTLRALFITSVSLSILLGLWKLIRG